MKVFYRFSWRTVRWFFRAAFGFRAIHAEKVPAEGPVILASNHRSYLDPPLIGVSIDREIHFLAKSELFAFRPFGRLISALNAHPVQRGRKDTAAIDQMIDLLKMDAAVVIFPEGTRQKASRGLGRPKSGVARLAQATGAPIVTVYIQGSRKIWRAILRRTPVRVYFGPAIRSEEYRRYSRDTKGFRILAGKVVEEIGRLMEAADKESGGEVESSSSAIRSK